MTTSSSCPSTLAICNALVYDGTGRPPVTADVIIKDGVVAAIDITGSLNLTGIRQLDATGLALAPGFIDAHSHSDSPILQCPTADSRVSQGITTEIVGNCGFSVGCQETRRTRDDGADGLWKDIRSYAAEVQTPPASRQHRRPVRTVTLRAMVIGYEPRPHQ